MTANGAGTIVSIKWDFDGAGSYPRSETIDTSDSDARYTTKISYDASGTYYATALVESHRDGDVHATSRRIPNLAAARIVVT